MTINAKVTKGAPAQDSSERLFKVLESIDWKLWEIYNMMKDNLSEKSKTPAKKTSKKTDEE